MSQGQEEKGRRDFFKLAGSAFGIAALSYCLGLRNAVKPSSSDFLPEYGDDGAGFPVFRPPYLQRDVNFAAFSFPADATALTVLCDRSLNSQHSFPYTYVPLTSNVLLVYADMLVSSMDERDAQVGSIPETEVSFWVLTIAMQNVGGQTIPHHLAWFVPYLFVNEGNSIATGREVHGFNKQAGVITKPVDVQNPQFSVDVLGITKFDPASVAQNERLLELQLLSSGPPAASWNKLEAARVAMVAPLLHDIRPEWEDDVVKFATTAFTEVIPLVLQKHFRHAGDGQRAVYRSIVEAPLQVETFREGGPLGQAATLTIRALDSHPIMRMLGLKHEQNATFSAWMKLDFILGLGEEYSLQSGP
jgi:hypothetical protein